MGSLTEIWPTLLMLAVLMGVILVVVFRGAKNTGNIEDYALGSVAFSPAAVGLALAASMTSAATFIINPGLIGLYGVSGLIAYVLVLPAAAFISLVLLTKRFRAHGTKVKALTMAQWMANRFGSKAYGTGFALLSILLVTFIVLIVVGLAQLLAAPLGADPTVVMVGIVIFVFGYMMFGGANSLVYTNTIQALLMLIVAVILILSGHEYFAEGWSGFMSTLETIDPRLTEYTNPDSFLFRDYFEIVFCQIVIGVAVVCQPHIITKSLILKDESQVNQYLLTAILTMVIFFSVVIVGLYARISFPDMTLNGNPLPPDQLVPAYIVENFRVGTGLLVTLGLIAAGISTLEGLIQSLSVTFTNDLFLSNSTKLSEWSNRSKILLNRGVIVGLAVLTVILSARQIADPDLSVAIFAQNGVYAFFSAAFFPLVMGMFSKKTSPIAAIVSSVTAILVHFSVYYGNIGPYMKGAINNPAIAATYAILISSAIGLLILLSAQKVSSVQPQTKPL
ncbi:sodium:solute symporter [Cryomorphaceae bacterium 1068]|nr:sodium:solute symporter [Cryomorphaceae bacterium 1068]